MGTNYLETVLNKRTYHGFTLVELLVVIVVIAIFAVMIFPVFGKGREKARQASCLTNQRQLAAGLLLSVLDNDEMLPAAEQVWQLIPANLQCKNHQALSNGYVYLGINAGKKLSEFADPESSCLTAEGGGSHSASPNIANYLDEMDLSRHQGQSCVSYLDGHAAMVTANNATLWLPERDFSGTLLCYVANALRDSHNAISSNYTVNDPNCTFASTFGASGSLLSSIRSSGKGDLYLPADESYISTAGLLIRKIIPVAYQHPVLAVPIGNPRNIKSINDVLTIPGLAIAFADPNLASISSFSKAALQGASQWDAFSALFADSGALAPSNIANVDMAAQAVVNGIADVAVVWDTTVKSNNYRQQLQAVETAPLLEARARVVIGLLSSSRHQYAAEQYAMYMSASDRGAVIFEKYGFEPIFGPNWHD